MQSYNIPYRTTTRPNRRSSLSYKNPPLNITRSQNVPSANTTQHAPTIFGINYNRHKNNNKCTKNRNKYIDNRNKYTDQF